MPCHVHILMWPTNLSYDISLILKQIKGKMSRKYGDYLKKSDSVKHTKYLITFRNKLTFRFWQRGGGSELSNLIQMH